MEINGELLGKNEQGYLIFMIEPDEYDKLKLTPMNCKCVLVVPDMSINVIDTDDGSDTVG